MFNLLHSDVKYVRLPNNLDVQASILPGQPVQSEIGERAQHGWTFENVAGQYHEISLQTLTAEINDLNLYVYGPQGRLYTMQANRSELQLRIQLPHSGMYTIVVRGAIEIGRYQLTLQSGATV